MLARPSGPGGQRSVRPRAALIFVKSPSHFRGVYGPIAQRLLTADTPGATACNIRRVPYTKVRRPIHPLDPG